MAGHPRAYLLLALLLAGWTAPALGAEPSPPDSPPDWSGAQAGDFIEYLLSAERHSLHGSRRSHRALALTLRIEVLSVHDDHVQVAVHARPEPGRTLPLLWARGLLFSMRRGPGAAPPETFFGYPLDTARQRPGAAGRFFLCQKLKAGITSSHGPHASGCVATSEPALYLGNGVVHFSTSRMGIRADGFSYELRLQTLGRAPPSGQPLPPLAFREGGGYERFTRASGDAWFERSTFRTLNGLVLDEGGSWSKQPGAKRRPDDLVFEGVRLSRATGPSRQPLLEFLYELFLFSLSLPEPSEGPPLEPRMITVGKRSVSARRTVETWEDADNNEAGERETFSAWEPWALEDAPIHVRFLPFFIKSATWPPGHRKQATTHQERTVRWY